MSEVATPIRERPIQDTVVPTITKMQRWEYHAWNMNKRAHMQWEGIFNKMGIDGWEFVAMADNYAIFKRPML
jgi:hypothetical protein